MIRRTVISRIALAVGLASGLAVPNTSVIEAQPIISTLPSWDGVTGAPLLSRDFAPASVGQTFTMPSDAAALNGISLFLGYSPLFFPFDQDLRFSAKLFGWNGTSLTDLLWQGPFYSGAFDVELTAQTIDIGGVPLLAGRQYAIVLSTVEADPFDPARAFITQFPAFQSVGLVDFDAYTGGALIQSYADNATDLFAAPWLVSESSDLAIELRFARQPSVVVPEPATVVLLASALVWLGLPVARRASRRATN